MHPDLRPQAKTAWGFLLAAYDSIKSLPLDLELYQKALTG